MTASPGLVTGPPRRHFLRNSLLLLLVLSGGVILLNHTLVSRPIGATIEHDDRNAGFSLHAHYRYYVDPSTLVLDVRDVRSVAPIDLFRVLFQAAETLQVEKRTFSTVLLANEGTTIFLMKGTDFSELGKSVRYGENPVYLIRTLPETLYDPDGRAAFGTWTGGVLGVLAKQMEDVTTAGRKWANGL
jgi:hypothetical protein